MVLAILVLTLARHPLCWLHILLPRTSQVLITQHKASFVFSGLRFPAFEQHFGQVLEGKCNLLPSDSYVKYPAMAKVREEIRFSYLAC